MSGDLIFTRAADSSGTLRLGDWGPPKPELQNGLLFRRVADGSADLVFGYTVNPSTAQTPDADVAIDADFAGDLDASIGVAAGRRLGIDADFDGDVEATVGLGWDANAQRPTVARTRAAWQPTAAQPAGTTPRHADGAALPAGTTTRWQRAASATAGFEHRLPAVLVPSWLRMAAAHQDAIRAQLASAFRHQNAARTWRELRSAFERAAPAHLPTGFAHQDGSRIARVHADASWQPAAPLAAVRGAHWQPADPYWLHRAARQQNAMRPPAGIYIPPPPEPERELCYDPATLGLLVFDKPYTGDGRLVFVCHKSGGGTVEPPAGAVVVARRRSYVVINSIEVRLAASGQLLPALDSGFSMRLDWRSWTWGFSISFHAGAEPLLRPAPGGDPVELEITVNGQPFRMLVESLRRSVRFPRAVVEAGGRGKAALLDAPYAPEQTFDQPAMINAQQLALDVLTANGVSMGWQIDWQLTDWTVPAGAWSYQGTWIGAVGDIAAAVGGYVQPHDTAQTLRILPAWPARAWGLAAAAPDIELPAGIAVVEETAWADKPAYNAIDMQGTPGNKLYRRKRAGTAGDAPAPMAVHALLVDAAAADQRAIAELSDTGSQIEQTLQIMVLPETGIIKPGTLLRYTDDAAVTRTGIVRATEVSQAGPRIDQTLTVQAPA